MHKKILALYIISTLIFFMIPVNKIFATNTEADTSINNKILIEDEANLLNEKQEENLKTNMIKLTEFGNVIFKTSNSFTNKDPLKYIQDYYYSKFRNSAGVAFYIDMNKRKICACATGGLDKVITNGKCDTITDNVYRYASNKDYYQCASEAFNQINKLLNGQKIAESMKYICNAILSLMLASFASFGIFKYLTGIKKAGQKEILKECSVYLEHTPIIINKIGTHRVYSPISDSSSGGSSHRRWFFWKWRRSEVAFLGVEEAIASDKFE